MYINYGAARLPASKLLFLTEEGTKAVPPPVRERGRTFEVLQEGLQGGRSGDKGRQSGATEAASANTIFR